MKSFGILKGWKVDAQKVKDELRGVSTEELKEVLTLLKEYCHECVGYHECWKTCKVYKAIQKLKQMLTL